jgi:hypothetical protein
VALAISGQPSAIRREKLTTSQFFLTADIFFFHILLLTDTLVRETLNCRFGYQRSAFSCQEGKTYHLSVFPDGWLLIADR